jgi:hypothetical protein
MPVRTRLPGGRCKVAIHGDTARVKPIIVVLLALASFDAMCHLAAEPIPLPRSRPAAAGQAQEGTPSPPGEPAPSACRVRLTSKLAIAPSLPPILGPGDCGGEDLVQLEAIVLSDKSRVLLTPPATLRCTFAEVMVQWVRDDVAPAARSLGSALKSIDNYASYDCRGRNRVLGAKLSEHGKANALDVRSLALSNGRVVRLTDPRLDKEFRERLQLRTCSRFMTVLGPGSDGYHEDHVHVDLAERRGGHRMCHWDIREEAEEASPTPLAVPLPRPRPHAAVGG